MVTPFRIQKGYEKIRGNQGSPIPPPFNLIDPWSLEKTCPIEALAWNNKLTYVWAWLYRMNSSELKLLPEGKFIEILKKFQIGTDVLFSRSKHEIMFPVLFAIF